MWGDPVGLERNPVTHRRRLPAAQRRPASGLVRNINFGIAAGRGRVLPLPQFFRCAIEPAAIAECSTPRRLFCGRVPQVSRFSRPGMPRPHQAWDFPLSRAPPRIKCETELLRSVPGDAWSSSTGELQIPHFVRDDNPFQVDSGVICRDLRGQSLLLYWLWVARLKPCPSRSGRRAGL
jgi:hypothetical protein